MNSLISTYSKEELEALIKECDCFNKFILKLGYTTHSGSNHVTVRKYLDENNIDYSHFSTYKNKPVKRTDEEVFVENSPSCRKVARERFKKGNYAKYECSICGQKPFWNGKEMTLILDHINGINNDHRLENLRWVCGNCNQQLETTNGKNSKKTKYWGIAKR